MSIAFILISLLQLSSCKEQPVDQQPGYKYGLADGKGIGYEEGREEMKVEICKKIGDYDDKIHSRLQRQRICG